MRPLPLFISASQHFTHTYATSTQKKHHITIKYYIYHFDNDKITQHFFLRCKAQSSTNFLVERSDEQKNSPFNRIVYGLCVLQQQKKISLYFFSFFFSDTKGRTIVTNKSDQKYYMIVAVLFLILYIYTDSIRHLSFEYYINNSIIIMIINSSITSSSSSSHCQQIFAVSHHTSIPLITKSHDQ